MDLQTILHFISVVGLIWFGVLTSWYLTEEARQTRKYLVTYKPKAN